MDLQEDKEFILVHDAVWNAIMKTYRGNGSFIRASTRESKYAVGGPDFPRTVITVMILFYFHSSGRFNLQIDGCSIDGTSGAVPFDCSGDLD